MTKVFVIIGIVGGLAIAYLATYAVGPIAQLPPSESLLTGFRERGIVPKTVNLEEDEAIEDAGVFTVPAQDKTNFKEIMANAGSMPGMNMGGDDAPKMKLNPDGTMKTNPDGSMVMEGQEPAMKMEGKTAMTKEVGGEPIVSDELEPGEGGLLFYADGQFDREIALDMDEWKFSNMQIEAKAGERIRFTVKNNGQIPHEFMFMNMPLMSSVDYRATRADWSLIEHVALFEKALVLPGGEFSFVLKVDKPGAWMFMCMLPYHMQMGMMGQMATPGMAMEM